MAGGRTSTEGVYLLDLVVGGHVYRFATEGCTVADAAGRAYEYLEGLQEPSLSYGSVAGVGDASISVEIQGEEDWALIVARGHALDRCSAVLRRWYSGRTLERARVILRGLTETPQYGALGESFQISIVRSMRDQTRSIPPVQAAIDSTTWPVTTSPLHAVLDGAAGASYPLVIGAPGGTEETTPVPCVPVAYAEYRAAAVTTSKVVWLGGDAVQVRLRRAAAEPATEINATASTTEDLLGRTVQWAAPWDSDENGKYLLGFRDDDTYGGGIKWRGELLRGAGSIIEWVLLNYYDGPVDAGRLAVVRSVLDAYKIDTYINSPVSAWDWLRKEVLSLLPVEMRESSQGVYPAVLRYDLTDRDAVAHLDATPGSGRVTRASSVTLIADIVNEVSVDFRPSSESGSKWLARVVVTGTSGYTATDTSSTSDVRVLRDPLCTASQARYGVRPLRIQAGSVWDTTTAIQIARQVVARRAWPRRAISYVGGPWLEDFEIGQAVTLTDPELHIAAAVALVADVTPGPGETQVDLLLLDSPLTIGGRSTS